MNWHRTFLDLASSLQHVQMMEAESRKVQGLERRVQELERNSKQHQGSLIKR